MVRNSFDETFTVVRYVKVGFGSNLRCIRPPRTGMHAKHGIPGDHLVKTRAVGRKVLEESALTPFKGRALPQDALCHEQPVCRSRYSGRFEYFRSPPKADEAFAEGNCLEQLF